MNDTAIQTKDLTKIYDGRTALDRVTFDIPTGSVVGLLGRNGAGKSTLIHALVGLLQPNFGSSTLLGEDSRNLSPNLKARIGVVLQQPKFYDWLTPTAMLDYAATFYPVEDRTLRERLMKSWDIPDNRKLSALSPGELQKFACILAMAHNPDLFILDEPCASLDPASRRDVIAEFIDIATEHGKTILVSTHIVSDLERLASQVLILHRGRLVMNESIDTLKETVKRLRIFPAQNNTAPINIPNVFELKSQPGARLALAARYTPETKTQVQYQTSGAVEVEDLSLEDIFLELTREYH